MTRAGKHFAGLALVALLVFLTMMATFGCGRVSRTRAAWSGYDQVCIGGVVYLQFTSGVSVKYDTEGRVVLCGGGQ